MNPVPPSDVEALLSGSPAGRSVHLVGAGGCGMSGLGHLLLDLGFHVSGSDVGFNDDIQNLRARGADIRIGHQGEALDSHPPAAVVYSSAIPADNPEIRAAQGLKLPILRRAAVLAALVRKYRGISVAGMHGKTTTAALLAFALDRLGQQPGFAIGASVPQLERHARLPSGVDPAPRYFVAETDESDGTLLEYHPDHAILLNVDAEHLDYYASLEAVCREFQTFAGQARHTVVFCADDDRLCELMATRAGGVSYGFNPLASYRIAGLGREGTGQARFEVWHRGALLGEFTTRLLGAHNVSNATAVIAMLHELGFAASAIAGAIAPFEGALRRQQLLFADHRFRVFEDYGHHPREIAATLEALSGQGPAGAGRLLVAFQPHRFTRTRHLLEEFATCFGRADRLWLTEVYAASEPEIAGVNGSVLARAIQEQGQAVEFVPDLADLPGIVRAAMGPGDLVVFLGAGDITHAAKTLAADLARERSTPGEEFLSALARAVGPGTVLRRNEPLSRRTTLRVGGPADVFVEPASEGDLSAVLRLCRQSETPFVVLGRGSNLLVRDGGVRGVVISLSQEAFARLEGVEERLRCGAGVRLKAVAVEARRRALTGLEFLEGIPGSVGGALRMNAGAMGAWMFDRVESLRFMDTDGAVHERRASEVNVEYRGCPLLRTHIALSAVLLGERAPRNRIEARMQSFSRKRWDSQPAAASAGCVFKNPASIPAGRLIDELGMKGVRVGGAAISEVHGNFIVNDGTATADDVLGLIRMIQERARSARGLDLETEVEILGEDIPPRAQA